MKNFLKKIIGPKVRTKELKEAISESPNEYVAAWCRQLICEPIMNNKKDFFKDDYQDIKNRRELFVISLKILNRMLDNEWGFGYVKGFVEGFISTDWYINLTVYDQNKKNDLVLEQIWKNELEESLIPNFKKSPFRNIDFIELSLNIKEYKKDKYKKFIKGYKAAIDDMKSFKFKSGEKRPLIDCKNLYSFLKKN